MTVLKEKKMEEIMVKEFIEEMREGVANARRNVYTISIPDEEEPMSVTSATLNGYRSGLYDGLEMALGILERLEDRFEKA